MAPAMIAGHATRHVARHTLAHIKVLGLPHQLYQTPVEEDMGIDHGAHGQETYKRLTLDLRRRG
jgi:hypothetical protein